MLILDAKAGIIGFPPTLLIAWRHPYSLPPCSWNMGTLRTERVTTPILVSHGPLCRASDLASNTLRSSRVFAAVADREFESIDSLMILVSSPLPEAARVHSSPLSSLNR